MQLQCDVAILRPPCTTLEGIHSENNIYTHRVDELIARIRDLLIEAAEMIAVKLCVVEYQLFAPIGRPHIVSPKRSRQIGTHPLIATIDPTPSELSYVFNQIDSSALGRGIVACTSGKILEDLYDLLGAKRLPLFTKAAEEVHYRKIPRCFAIHLPLNSEEEASLHNNNLKTAEQALAYPHVPGNEASRQNFFHPLLVARDGRTSEKYYRQYLVEEDEAT